MPPDVLSAPWAGSTCTWAPPGPPQPPPPLYPFQEEGVRFLMERRAALLCDEMGLGKSIQAIAAARRLFAGGQIRRALVLCPKTLQQDWWEKFRRWAPELVCCLPARRRRTRHWDWHWGQSQVWIAGYETWREDHREVNPAAFDLVILDEIQRIKNRATALSQAVLTLQPAYRWGLTGTPLENRVEDLAGVFAFLVPGLLAPERGLPPEGAAAAIAPHVLRREKGDVLHQLPAKAYRIAVLDLTPAQARAYGQAAAAVGGRWGDGAGFALLTALKEICDLDPATGASAKGDFLLRELPPILARGEKALVFSQYPDKVLTPLLPRLLPLGACLFSGALSPWEREAVVKRFQEEDWPRVLLVSLRAGGTGLTLHRANHVYHFDHWWNPAVMAQAEDRVHRIGQCRPVQITSLVTRGTIEEQILALLEQKRQLFARVMAHLPGEDDLLHRLAAQGLLAPGGLPGEVQPAEGTQVPTA